MGLFSKIKITKEIILTSPLQGSIVPLESVPDETFAKKILGDGVAIEPIVGKLYSSADGVVLSVTDTGHAISIQYDNGADVLMHIGVDTVELKGDGYTPKVKTGDRVKKGEELIAFDIDYIKARGYNLITPVIITNSDEFKSIEVSNGKANFCDKLITLKK